ncbi:hypothetical protein [Leucobacter musarum]|uniref:hypothetical protein n=1 Tax=Leucobacter musarum TaxID=1930747 RepID=UPI0006A7E045|nr:hypothetical protein [Leucobacter musarum]
MNPFRLSTRLQPPARTRARPVVAEAASAEAHAAVAPGQAVVVPWRISQRSASGVIEIENAGGGPLHSVRFTLAGDGMLGLSLPRTVLPGERLRVVLRGVRSEAAVAAPDAMLVLRWFQPDGRELLWPIALM